MKSSQYYDALADQLPGEQLEDEFYQILGADSSSAADEVSEALFQLSVRQWNSYELPKQELRQKVTRSVLRMWDNSDAKRAECLLAVISRMGLGDAFRFIRKMDAALFSKEVNDLVQEAVAEFGDTVDDPYSGVRR